MAIVLSKSNNASDQFELALSESVTRVREVQGVYEHLEKHPDENLLLIDNEIPLGVAADISRRYRVERPALGVLVMRDFIDVQSLSEALGSGIRELVTADDANALLIAVRRSKALSEQIEELDGSSTRPAAGKTILVFGAKGGSGKTTIATNLALALASSEKTKVCIVDLDLELGDVALYLGLDPKVTLSNAMKMQGGLDRKAVESLVTTYKPGLDAILSPVQPAEAEFITADIVVELIQHLRQMYQYVIIDTARSFAEVNLRCFELADSIQLVTSLDVSSLKNLRVAIETLEILGHPRSKWNVVLNRANSKVGLALKDVEDLLGMQVKTRVPSSGAVPATLNVGKNMWESERDHQFTQAVSKLAQTISGAELASHKPKQFWRSIGKKR